MISTMKSGSIVEYIDQQKIMCAVVLEVKKQRLRLLTENNREVNLSAGRLSYRGEIDVDLSVGRNMLLHNLKKIVTRRKTLTDQVDIKELWEVLNTEQEWIDLATMTEFCFPNGTSYDYESAVVRAFFKDSLYFKFNIDRFFPNSEERVEQIQLQTKLAERKNRLIENGAGWLRRILQNKTTALQDNALSAMENQFVEILKSYYLFDNESQDTVIAKGMLKKAGIGDREEIFRLMVLLGIWDADENIELLRNEIPVEFPPDVNDHVGFLTTSPAVNDHDEKRRDLTGLSLITIDGQATLDFDDALSIEEKKDHYLLGVHIADVGQYVKKGDPIDREAMNRGSSIYMPDNKIPMIPADLAENLCSLKAGELRAAISTIIRLNSSGDVIEFDVMPSWVRVKHQLSYYDANLAVDEKREIGALYDIACKFRRKRLDHGAIHISLPEVNIWIDDERQLNISKTNRESPGRMLVAEIMIMANWLMARFLSERRIPGIFRSQAEPRGRLIKDQEGTLFQNWMQRKQLSRFVLVHEAEFHSGLGLEAYVTATSPIRKYFDLVTQRQLRSIFGLETPYSAEEIKRIIQLLERPTGLVARIQFGRNRYWLLRYLEAKIGRKESAVVLQKFRNHYQVLLTEYMIECSLPLSAGINLKPEDLIQVTIQHVNARKDILSIYLG